jgi:hypothetical protein
MYETAHMMAFGTLKERVRPEDVRLGELEGVAERAVDVRLRGKMEDGVDLIVVHDQADELEVQDVPLDELEILALKRRLEILEIGTIIKDIETHKPNSGVFRGHEVADMRADEARASGDQDTLRDVFGHFLIGISTNARGFSGADESELWSMF